MGLDPELDDYEEGIECPACVDILFDGKTPKYVEADVSDILRCPGAPGVIPNGTWLLTQKLGEPCIWENFDLYPMTWDLTGGQSKFYIRPHGWLWFASLILDVCFDAFPNELDCADPGVLGHEGYALIWWGPTIGP